MHDSDKRDPTAKPPHEAADNAAPADDAANQERVVRPGVWSPPPRAKAAGAAGDDDGDRDGHGADAGPDPASDEETPVERISRLEAEKSDLTDRLLRTAAEMENLRKRSQRDLDDTRRYGVSRFADDMLAVGDNLQRALGSVSDEALAAADAALKSVIDGVEMTAREFERALEKHGVARIAAKGERFDPHRHQAIFQVPRDDVPAGTVIEEVQPGYMIGERVLRAAMVGVARGGPKPGEGDTQAAAEGDEPDAGDAGPGTSSDAT